MCQVEYIFFNKLLSNFEMGSRLNDGDVNENKED